MLDGSYFFECRCGANEHTLRFILDLEERELYASIFLDPTLPWWRRLWIGIKYIFGVVPSFGHFGTWVLREEDVERLRGMCEKLNK